MNFNNNISPSIEKNNVEVKIGNISYNLTTTESEDYINGIAKYINNKIDELSLSHSNLNSNSIPFFITTALNIADDLFKQRKQFTQSSNTLKSLEESYLKLKENSLSVESLKAELKDKLSEISSLKTEISTISNDKTKENKLLEQKYLSLLETKEQEISVLNSNIESLTKENSCLKNDISSLNEKILSSEDEIVSLKSKINDLNEKILFLENKNSEFSSLEYESITLLYEKDEEIARLDEKVKELTKRLNISNET